MAKVGSWKWEGKQKIQKSLDESHEEEIRQCEAHGHDFEEDHWNGEIWLDCCRCGHTERIQ